MIHRSPANSLSTPSSFIVKEKSTFSRFKLSLQKMKTPDVKLLVGTIIICTIFLLYTIRSVGNSTAEYDVLCPVKPNPSAPILQQPLPVTNVLITGGAGYIGSHMTLLLFEKSEIYNIVAVDDLSRGDIRNVESLKSLCPQDRHYTFVQADIGDTVKMTETLKQHSIDIVIHFAGFAYASESVQYPLKYFENTVQGTANLLSAIDTAGVSRLVYSSSSATYGTITDEKCDLPITEFSPQKPVSPYGLSKLMAEQEITAYANSKHIANKDFSYAALRYFNVIGADEKQRVGPLPKKHLAHYGRIVDSCFHAAITGGNKTKCIIHYTSAASLKLSIISCEVISN